MSSSADIKQIGDVAELITKGTTPTTLGFTYKQAGINFIKVESIDGNGRLLPDKFAYIDSDAHSALKRSQIAEFDVLFTIAGTIGRVAIADRSVLPANTNQAVAIIRPDRSKVLPRYLKYAISTNDFLQNASQKIVQGVQANFSLGELKSALIRVPSIEEQHAICASLNALDDRIDNLRATNATLEAIAQAIFKSWFIDFDPVRAKMEGREPEGMDAETAALFPSEFEESELGLIPRGWRVSTVGDVAAIVKGRSYKSSELADSTTALVTLKSFERGGGFRLDGFKGYTGTYKPEQVVNVGECIIAFTDVTQQAEVIGRGALVFPSPLHSILVASLDVGIIRPLSSSVSTLFLHHLLQGDRYVSHIGGFTSGTTVLHLAKLGVPSYRFAIPNSELIASFTDLVKPLWNRRVSNESTRYKLADLRDQLLPRLISGKLRIDEAQEAVVESA